MKPILSLVALTALGAACEQVPPETRLINDAAVAMGGVDQIQAADTLVLAILDGDRP